MTAESLQDPTRALAHRLSEVVEQELTHQALPIPLSSLRDVDHSMPSAGGVWERPGEGLSPIPPTTGPGCAVCQNWRLKDSELRLPSGHVSSCPMRAAFVMSDRPPQEAPQEAPVDLAEVADEPMNAIDWSLANTLARRVGGELRRFHLEYAEHGGRKHVVAALRIALAAEQKRG